MLRVLFDLRGIWWRASLNVLLLGLMVLLLSATFAWTGVNFPLLMGFFAILTGIWAARYQRLWPRWLWALTTSARGFRRVTGSRIVLYMDPRCECRTEAFDLIELCDRHVNELADWFGFPLKRRLLAFVFVRSGDVTRISRGCSAAFAVEVSTAIVVSVDNSLEATVRHEIAHLFVREWNRRPLPLLNEGLATWLQRRNGEMWLEISERQFLERQPPRLTDLLNPWRFWAGTDRWRSYVLAGSFTGFLLRRYGKDRYRQFFQQCTGPAITKRRFEKTFERVFGVPLSEAEHRWRVEALVMPVLERRLERELNDGQFVQ